MRCSDLRVRILAVIGATTVAGASVVACGSEDAASSSGQGDAADERADALADAREETPFFAEASFPDVIPTDSADDERPQSPRRPFLIGSSLRSARREWRGDWVGKRVDPASVLGIDESTRADLAASWLADALEEHASIAAFARFTMLLLSVGAPPELVVDSQRASIDEIAHARDCFALARRYATRSAGPGALDVHDSLPPMPLADLAALTTEEGCVGETLGTALAAEQLAVATDEEVRRVLGRVVRDETRHAQLAWRFVAWAIAEERAGARGAAGVASSVRQAAERAISATRAMTIRPDPTDVAAWHAHGRLTCAESRECSERAIREVVLPCLELLTPARREAVVRPQACDGGLSSV